MIREVVSDIHRHRARHRNGQFGEEHSRGRVSRPNSANFHYSGDISDDAAQITGLYRAPVDENWDRTAENTIAAQGDDQRHGDGQRRIDAAAAMSSKKQ